MPKFIIGIIIALVLLFAVNSSGRMMGYIIRATGAGTIASGDAILWEAAPGDKILWDEATGDAILWE